MIYDGARVQQMVRGGNNEQVHVQGEDEPCVFVNTTTGIASGGVCG